MAKKVILGKRPESFTRVVEFPMLDGEVGAIECVFKYRDRKEFGALLDETFSREAPDLIRDGKLSSEAQQEAIAQANGEYLSKVLLGWNLDREFSREACVDLSRELPGAAKAVMDAYRDAVVEGRLGN